MVLVSAVLLVVEAAGSTGAGVFATASDVVTDSVAAGVATGVATGVGAGVATGGGVAAACVELVLVSTVPVVAAVAVPVVSAGGAGGVSASEFTSGANVVAMYSPIVYTSSASGRFA